MSRPPLARLRSLLFAPGNRPEVLAKLPRSEPDAAAIDLEDAVAPLAKEAARATARSAAEELAAEHPGLGLFIRVNAVPTEWFAADVAEALSPVLHGVLVPKLESADQVTQVVAALDAQGLGSLGIVAGLESAAGVERATEIVGASPRVVAAYFGAEDYVADLGGVRTVGNDEVLYARSRVVLATRLASVRSLDIVVSDFSDEERFRADAAQGRALGYTGKLCIHPAQVGWANELFAPSPAQLERARALVDAYDAALASGEAAIVFDGQMIDEALVRTARAMLDATDRLLTLVLEHLAAVWRCTSGASEVGEWGPVYSVASSACACPIGLVSTTRRRAPLAALRRLGRVAVIQLDPELDQGTRRAVLPHERVLGMRPRCARRRQRIEGVEVPVDVASLALAMLRREKGEAA